MSRKKRGAHVVSTGIRKRYAVDGRTVRSYEVRYRDPNKLDKFGNPVLRSKCFRTLDEAEDFQLRKKLEIRDGGYLDPDDAKRKWGDIADEWLRVKEAQGRRARTISGHRNRMDCWLADWKERRIDSIKSSEVWAVIERLRDEGRSVGTERHVYYTMNCVFSFAVRKGYLKKNPAEPHREDLRGAINRDEEDFESTALTREQAESIINALPEGRFRLYGLTALWTGCRAGELAGLRVRNLDVVNGCVQVLETIEDLGGELRPGTTKTKKSRGRRIPIPRAIMKQLTAYVKANDLGPDAYLFAGPNKYFRHANFYKRQWRDACKETGFWNAETEQVTVRFHDLRHTFVSLRIEEGWPERVVAEWVGHANLGMTRNYTHVYENPERDRELIERMFTKAQQRASERPKLRVVEGEAS